MPSGGSRLVLLHISDLHFCGPEASGHYWNTEATELAVAPHNRRGLLGSLLYDLRHEDLSPHLVIVSGDLLDRGHPSGVELAVAFLRALAEGLGLPPNRVILAPGNHDVLRSGPSEGRYVLFDQIRQGLYGDARPPFPEDTAPHLRVDHHLFEDLGVEVVAFNSCEDLEPSAQKDHGSIGIGQRDHAETILLRTAKKNLFRIAVLHHHLDSPEGVSRADYSIIPDARGVCRFLAREKFHLALHGHQHVDWHEVREIEGWFLAIAAAASAGVSTYGRKEWSLPISYQVIDIETSTRGRRVRREYNPQTMEWADAGRGDDVQALRFGSAEEAVSSKPVGGPPPIRGEEIAMASLSRRGRIEVKIQHVERAIESQRTTLRVQIASIGAATTIAFVMALYLAALLSPWLSLSGGCALLFAGCIALPMRLASYRETLDKLHFLRDGYKRCVSYRDDELSRVLDERFSRLI